MNTIGCLLVVALAITAEAGMMGGPPGAGGPPGGIGAGPPPFVQAIIAGKGKPFGGGPGGPGGPPGGIGAGPPPFVQAIIAGKGKPFGGPPAPAPAAPAPDPMPAYIQSLLAAKMAAATPFIPPVIPMGPPPFVQQLIAAKNAAAAQQAAEEAAAAQELAAYQAQAQTAGVSGSPLPSLNASRPLALGPPPFVQNIIAQKGSPSAASPAAAAPPDWIQQLLATQMAKKAATKLPPGLLAPGPQPSQLGSPNTMAQSGPGMQRRQAELGVPQQSVAPAPVQYAPPPTPYALPPPGSYPPMPYPMMPFPFFNPMMPLWKMG